MPIEKPNNSLYRIRDLSVIISGGEYLLSMNPGKANACVLCISRNGKVRAEDLALSEKDINMLFNGGRIETPDYLLRGISGQQLTALAQYRGLQLQPPVYVQAWAIASSQNGKVLYVPDDVTLQRTLVPVNYHVIFNVSGLIVKLDDPKGYQDGDLMYKYKERLPVPIPKSWIGKPIPLRNGREGYQVIPAPDVEENYIQG